MLKKLLFACTLTATIFVSCVTVKAGIFDFQGFNTHQIEWYETASNAIMKVIRPEDGDAMYKKSCVISGQIITDSYENMTVEIYVKNRLKDDSADLEPLVNTDGVNRWVLKKEDGDKFLKEVQLPRSGRNLIRVVTYKGVDPEAAFNNGEYQIDEFTVIYLDDMFKRVFNDGTYDFTTSKYDWVMSIR